LRRLKFFIRILYHKQIWARKQGQLFFMPERLLIFISGSLRIFIPERLPSFISGTLIVYCCFIAVLFPQAGCTALALYRSE